MGDVKKSGLLHHKEGIQHKEGIHQTKDALVVLVKTDWNSAIVGKLEAGCLKVLHTAGVKTITVVVPGAVEIPFAVAAYWRSCKKKKQPDAFITLGCVIRGGTPHFEYVCQSVTTGVTQLNLTLPVPVVFGVLTVDNEEQAKERTGGEHGNKGEEAAHTAIKMITYNRRFKSS